MTTKKTYREIEKEKERGRLRYLERVQEEKEADLEIKEFVPEELEYPENDETKRVV